MAKKGQTIANKLRKSEDHQLTIKSQRRRKKSRLDARGKASTEKKKGWIGISSRAGQTWEKMEGMGEGLAGHVLRAKKGEKKGVLRMNEGVRHQGGEQSGTGKFLWGREGLRLFIQQTRERQGKRAAEWKEKKGQQFDGGADPTRGYASGFPDITA